MSLGLVSPLLNRGVRSRWVSTLPASSKMLTIDAAGDVSYTDIPTAAWGSITGTLSSQTDLQNALDAKLSLSGGTMTGAILIPTGTAGAPSIAFTDDTDAGIYRQSNAINFSIGGTLRQQFQGDGSIVLSGTDPYLIIGTSLALSRDGNDILAQKRATAAQTFRIYNTFTDASNYERGQLAWESNEFRIGATAAGTGTQRNTVLGSWNSGGTFTPGVTVASTGVVTIGVGGANPLILSGVTGQAPKITLGTAGQGYIEHSSGTLNLGYSYADQVSIGGTQTTIRNQLNNTQGTITASTPLTLTQTWNNVATTFTGILANVTDTASNGSSLLMDLQVGGSSKFRVQKGGNTFFSIGSMTYWNSLDNSYTIAQAASNGGLGVGGTDVVVIRDAAQTLAQRNGTNAQAFRVYNTYTDASNYERGKIEWSSNVLRIGTEKAGTGSARALELQTDGTTRLTVGATGNVGIGTGDTTDLLTVRAATPGTPQGLTISGQTSVRHATLTLTHDQKTAKVGLSRLSGDIITANNGYELVVSNTDSICIATNNASGVIRFLTGSLVEALRITSGGIVALGGVTSSFPSIKRNGTAINFRLADDSADAGITASTATFSGNVTVSAVNIVTDTTTGTKIGTATTQKIGFYDKTPVVQPAAVADATDAASVITQLNLLLSRMRDLGLIAT